MNFSPSPLWRQRLSSSEMDALKPTESERAELSPRDRYANLQVGLASSGGLSKRGFEQKGPSCPFAVPVAWFCPLWFSFFLCPCRAWAAAMALLWKRELYKPSGASSFELLSVTAVPMPNEAELRHVNQQQLRSQNHRMVGVGRDLCGSSSPTPCRSRIIHTL